MSFKDDYIRWKKLNKVHGPSAHDRFVKLYFLMALNQVTDEFVFKGGNLLWFYINTPRPTVDLDLSSSKKFEGEKVIELFESVNQHCKGIQYNVVNYKEGEFGETVGLKVFLTFQEESGARNKFHIDVVMGLSSDIRTIKLGNEIRIKAASYENILTDKLSACQSFGEGSTRAKDYDDLYRMALDTSISDYDKTRLKSLCETKDVRLELDYVNDESSPIWSAWKTHIKMKHYKKNQLPGDLNEVISVVNAFLNDLSA